MICFEKRLLGYRVKMFVYFFQSGVKKGRRAEKSVKAPPAPEFEPSGNDSPQPQAAAVVCFCLHFYNGGKKTLKYQIQEVYSWTDIINFFYPRRFLLRQSKIF